MNRSLCLSVDLKEMPWPFCSCSCNIKSLLFSVVIIFNRFIMEFNFTNTLRSCNHELKRQKNVFLQYVSRIDHILFSIPLLHCVFTTDMFLTLISDHSPVICDITPIMAHSKMCRLCFNSSLLYNCYQFRSGLMVFLEVNTCHCSNPQVFENKKNQ